jgi:hypothetical protein
MKNVAVWLLAFCFLACSINDERQTPLAAATPAKLKKAKVTLQVFSGRENPSWSLSEKQIDELLALLKDLPKAEPSDFQDGLGYSGFQVELTGNATEKTQTIVASKGRIFYKTAEAEAYFDDPKRRLETFLLKSGDAYLEKNLSESVRNEIESPGN